MEVFVFDWWWRSHQSLAREGLRIFRFSVVPWKGESEPNIKYCFGATVGMVQRFIKRFPAGHWSFLGPGSETKWYSTYNEKTWRRMGQSRWIDADQIRRKRTPSFPSHESIVPRNAQKQKRWKIIYTLLCRWRYDWNCFSHNHFC